MGGARRAPPATRLRVADIPYPETRAYVHRVLHLKAAYRKAYGDRRGFLSPQLARPCFVGRHPPRGRLPRGRPARAAPMRDVANMCSCC